MRRIAGWMVTGVMLLGAAASANGTDAPSVVVDPAVTATRSFDPARPPAEMPHLHPGEAAVTQSDFRCSANAGYRRAAGERHVIITDVSIHVSLATLVWLPTDPKGKLIDHEQGHRRIAEIVYDDAEKAAADAARPLIGQRVDVSGLDDEGIEAKINAILQTASQTYLSAIAGRSGRVNEVYDAITDHGRAKIDEKTAIERAFSRAAPKP